MKFARIFLLFFAFGFVPACGILPQYRVGQKAVPPPVGKTLQQLEAERQGAQFVADTITAPAATVPVARAVSDSLGKPKEPLPTATPEQVDQSAAKALEALGKQMAKMQERIDAQNKFLTKYAGTKLEGTGFDLMGPGMVTLVIGLIVLGVLCPPALTIMFFIFRRMKAAAGIVVNEMEAAAKAPETKEAVAKIKVKVAEKMQAHKQPTSALKQIITNLKT